MKNRQNFRGPTSIDKSSSEMETKEKPVAVANDKIEQTGRSKSEPAVQRKSAEEEETVQRKEKGTGPVEVSSEFQSAVSPAQNGGNTLDRKTSLFMSSKFGTDFSNVKIHNNSRAHHLAQSINAKAFTVGEDIYFNEGEYQPETSYGKKLLAHELTHTLQQSGKVQRKPDGEAWYKHILEANYYMPYEVMMLLHGASETENYKIPEDKKAIFEDWRETLERERANWGQRRGAGESDAERKAQQMYTNLGNLAKGLNTGKIQKRHVTALKKEMGAVAFRTAYDWRGTGEATCMDLTAVQLVEIFKAGDLAEQIENKGKDEGFYSTEYNRHFSNVDAYLKAYIVKDDMIGKINTAFRIMGINTVEAQAVYLAHAAGETSNLLGLTEQKSKYTDNYKNFEGRGVFHTTLRKNYIRTIAYMESLLNSEKIDKADKKKIEKTIEEIKKDPKEAANPEYTFLFSGAYMHTTGGVKASADLVGKYPNFLGKDAASSWVAGQDVTQISGEIIEDGKTGFELRAELKAKVYKKAVEVLSHTNCAFERYGYEFADSEFGPSLDFDVRPGPVRRTLIKPKNK